MSLNKEEMRFSLMYNIKEKVLSKLLSRRLDSCGLVLHKTDFDVPLETKLELSGLLISRRHWCDISRSFHT